MGIKKMKNHSLINSIEINTIGCFAVLLIPLASPILRHSSVQALGEFNGKEQ